ncbi:GNAT family N-acetyltransferase [Spirillospora sp. NPDC052269]
MTEVDIRLLEEIGELEAVRRLYERIWRTGATGSPVTADFLRALAKAGGYVSGAWEGDELIGACFGFFAPPPREALHSHIAGVLARAQGRNIGFALKVHQRAWALEHGAREIWWTFDPLIRRNAHFNLVKLGAEATEYLPDFYGPMDDDVNRTDPTDRLFARWRLSSPDVEAACTGGPRTATVSGAALLAMGPDGAPLMRRPTEAKVVTVAVPDDIEALREHHPALASAWRMAVREVLGGLLDDDDCKIIGFDRTAGYIVERA